MGEVERNFEECSPHAPREDYTRLRTFRASDGYTFYFRHYPAGGTPKARIVFVHGIRSHGGWYALSCRRLAEAGFEVFFLDRRGGGLNTAHRGDAPNFRRLLDDAAEFVKELRNPLAGRASDSSTPASLARPANQPDLPIVLAGISWGGKLAVGLQYRAPGLVDGLVLLCPGLVPRIAPPFVRRMRIAIARVFRPWKLFPIPLNEPNLFTASAEWQAFIERESHGLRLATARFLFGSFSLDIYLKRAAQRVNVPTLLMLGGEDRIIENAGTRKFVGRFNTATSIVDYPGAHHTLEFEGEGHPWIDDLIGWIERRVIVN